jgi:hypothetical protein
MSGLSCPNPRSGCRGQEVMKCSNSPCSSAVIADTMSQKAYHAGRGEGEDKVISVLLCVSYGSCEEEYVPLCTAVSRGILRRS